MKAYTFRVFNRRCVARVRLPDGCDVDDDRREAFLVETHAFLSPDRRRVCLFNHAWPGTRRTSQTAVEPSARYRTSRDVHDDAPPTKPRAPDTSLPPSACSSVSSRSRRRRMKTNDLWPSQATLDDDARKMLYGSLFSLKQFIAKLRPVARAERRRHRRQKTAQYYSFRTNNYKMHVRETAPARPAATEPAPARSTTPCGASRTRTGVSRKTRSRPARAR